MTPTPPTWSAAAAAGQGCPPLPLPPTALRWGQLAHRAWIAPVPGVLRENAWFIALAILYLAVGYGAAWFYGREVRLGMYTSLHMGFYFNFASAFVIGRSVWILARRRPERPLRFLCNDLRDVVFTPRRILNALPVLALLPLVLSMMTSLKRMIAVVSPFSWDARLAEIDRFVHGGVAPWELLQPLFGYPIVTVAVSYIYTVPWFVMVTFLSFWSTFSADPRRMRFLLTYVLCWSLLGNALATATSSAGPCFYAAFVDGADPFAPLLEYLTSVAAEYRLPSILGQEFIWAAYRDGVFRTGSGISAMPSMHIATAYLFVLVCWPRHRFLRWSSVLFLAVILVGSVHLGWHYAIDGYVAILAASLIWYAVGRALQLRDRRRGLAATPRFLKECHFS